MHYSPGCHFYSEEDGVFECQHPRYKWLRRTKKYLGEQGVTVPAVTPICGTCRLYRSKEDQQIVTGEKQFMSYDTAWGRVVFRVEANKEVEYAIHTAPVSCA